jgi:hypothetical protein
MTSALALSLLFGIATLEADVSLSDLESFPPHEAAVQAWEFQKKHLAYLEAAGQASPFAADRCYWEQRAAEFAKVMFDWESLYIATNPKSHISSRMSRLRLLRKSLGWQAYREGRMPEPVRREPARCLD